MKIVSRKEFLSLPVNTLYSRYEPCVFYGLQIKTSPKGYYTDDFNYQDIIGNVERIDSQYFDNETYQYKNADKSIDLNFEDTERDGEFDQDQLFAVYEHNDIVSLIERLKSCL